MVAYSFHFSQQRAPCLVEITSTRSGDGSVYDQVFDPKDETFIASRTRPAGARPVDDEVIVMGAPVPVPPEAKSPLVAAALWSASVGFSAIQDAMNVVYEVTETRSYWKARGAAILVTLLLSMIVTLTLASLLAGDSISGISQQHFAHHFVRVAVAVASRTIAWGVAAALLILLFRRDLFLCT